MHIISRGNNRDIYTRIDGGTYLLYANTEYPLYCTMDSNRRHIALSMETGGTIQAYCNGSLSSVITLNNTELKPIGGDILLGSRQSEEDNGYELIGNIDELRRFDHSLTTGDVDMLYRGNLRKYQRYDSNLNSYIPRRDFVIQETVPSYVEGVSLCMSGDVQDFGGWETSTGGCVLVDSLPPSGSFTINTGATFTNTSAVVLNFSNITGAILAAIGNSTYGESTYTPIPSSTGRTLLANNGTKTVLGQFNDQVGNVYYTNDSIILDTVAPLLPGRSRAIK